MQNVLACTTETDFNNKSIDPLKWSLFWDGMVKKDGPFQYCTGQMENHSRVFLTHTPQIFTLDLIPVLDSLAQLPGDLCGNGCIMEEHV